MTGNFIPKLSREFEVKTIRDIHRRAANSFCESWFLIHQMFVVMYLFVLDDSLTS